MMTKMDWGFFCSEGMVVPSSYWQWVNWKLLFDLWVYRMFARQMSRWRNVDFWHINFGESCNKAAWSNWIISSVLSLFCSCQNNHIISHEESTYQQIKKTPRHDDMFCIFDAMWHVASPAPCLAISMALSICRATKGCPGVSEGKPNLWWVWWRRWWVPSTIGIYS